MAEYFLGIETSGSATGIALIDAKRVISETSLPGTNHNEVLVGLIARTLESATVKPADLKGIGVTIGPGMFTALRVGLSVAEGIALPYSIPVKGIDTLLALSLTANRPHSPVLSAMDARKQQVYAGLYRNGMPLRENAVLKPEGLPGFLENLVSQSETLILVGDGMRLCRESLRPAGFPVELSGVESPAPSVIARLGRELILKHGGDDTADLAPVYLRRTDAELRREELRDSRNQGL